MNKRKTKCFIHRKGPCKALGGCPEGGRSRSLVTGCLILRFCLKSYQGRNRKKNATLDGSSVILYALPSRDQGRATTLILARSRPLLGSLSLSSGPTGQADARHCHPCAPSAGWHLLSFMMSVRWVCSGLICSCNTLGTGPTIVSCNLQSWPPSSSRWASGFVSLRLNSNIGRMIAVASRLSGARSKRLALRPLREHLAQRRCSVNVSGWDFMKRQVCALNQGAPALGLFGSNLRI